MSDAGTEHRPPSGDEAHTVPAGELISDMQARLTALDRLMLPRSLSLPVPPSTVHNLRTRNRVIE